MTGFASLKKKRKSSFADLAKLMENQDSKKKGTSDDRIYYPQLDQAGNGYARIRFIESKHSKEDDEIPTSEFVRVYRHIWKEPSSRWMFDDCPTTIGKPCEICADNSALWATGLDIDKATAREHKRKTSYYANIVVLEDPSTPENVGKVFLLRFGARIFDKIKSAMFPEFQDEQPFNPFDYWEGADFKLKIRKIDNQINYDRSEFCAVGPAADSDQVMKQLFDATYDLGEFIDSKLFSTPEEQRNKLNRLTGTPPSTATATTAAESVVAAAVPAKRSAAAAFSSTAPENVAAKPKKSPVDASEEAVADMSDENIDEFFDDLMSS